MPRLSQLQALALIAAVLVGVQCREVCPLLAQQKAALEASAKQMPCHKHQEDSKPVNDSSCAHREIVAEKRTTDTAPDAVQQLVAGPVVLAVAFVAVVAPLEVLVVSSLQSPPLSPLAASGVLRI